MPVFTSITHMLVVWGTKLPMSHQTAANATKASIITVNQSILIKLRPEITLFHQMSLIRMIKQPVEFVFSGR